MLGSGMKQTRSFSETSHQSVALADAGSFGNSRQTNHTPNASRVPCQHACHNALVGIFSLQFIEQSTQLLGLLCFYRFGLHQISHERNRGASERPFDKVRNHSLNDL